MATFIEWQATLSEVEQARCNELCNKEEERRNASGFPKDAEGRLIFPNDEARKQYQAGADPEFVSYRTRYEISQQ